MPIDRAHIVGHAKVPAPRGGRGGSGHHTDPGPYWRWGHYLALVRRYAYPAAHAARGGEAPGRPTPRRRAVARGDERRRPARRVRGGRPRALGRPEGALLLSRRPGPEHGGPRERPPRARAARARGRHAARRHAANGRGRQPRLRAHDRRRTAVDVASAASCGCGCGSGARRPSRWSCASTGTACGSTVVRPTCSAGTRAAAGTVATCSRSAPRPWTGVSRPDASRSSRRTTRSLVPGRTRRASAAARSRMVGR